MASHVLHFAVESLIEPAQEMLLILGDVDARDAELGKSDGTGPCRQLEFGRMQVDRVRISHNVFTAVSIMPHGFADCFVLYRAGPRPRCPCDQGTGNSRLYLDETGWGGCAPIPPYTLADGPSDRHCVWRWQQRRGRLRRRSLCTSRRTSGDGARGRDARAA